MFQKTKTGIQETIDTVIGNEQVPLKFLKVKKCILTPYFFWKKCKFYIQFYDKKCNFVPYFFWKKVFI